MISESSEQNSDVFFGEGGILKLVEWLWDPSVAGLFSNLFYLHPKIHSTLYWIIL